jgi:hypothetical protein
VFILLLPNGTPLFNAIKPIAKYRFPADAITWFYFTQVKHSKVYLIQESYHILFQDRRLRDAVAPHTSEARATVMLLVVWLP